ncbi:MAG: sigma-54 dependent transcriptional regulator [Rhodoferax sp.]|nr:sigma-54 dependent transcriptional regulator [Rhodoferax sp.]
MTPVPPKICLLEDDEIMGESLADRFALEGLHCDWYRTGAEALGALREQDYGLVISDIRLPDSSGDALFEQLLTEQLHLPPFIFITGHGDIDCAVRLLKKGARDYITKPFDLDALIDKIQDIIAPAHDLGPGALGLSPAMRQIEAMLQRLASSAASVLITGESGVGKERVAQALHQLTGGGKPFIAVNCGALTESLLEAELFGYEKGAFTGAARTKKGVFEQAHGGTLFLDEIGDMSLSAQAKVLRALQENKIMRVGGEKDITVDVRVIAATNKDLNEEIENKRFREDLYHRLSVILIRVPPLRERKEDIPILANHFLEDISSQAGKAVMKISDEAIVELQKIEWTGNIREFRNVLERLAILCEKEITSEDVKRYAHPLNHKK